MKLLKTWQFLCLMLSILSLTSCSKSEDLDESDKWICILPPDDGTPLFTLDADSLPHFKNFKPISQSQFQKDIVGYGWNCNALQTIYNDGRFSNDNLIGSMLGLGPDHYYITKEKITKFFYVLEVLPSIGLLISSLGAIGNVEYGVLTRRFIERCHLFVVLQVWRRCIIHTQFFQCATLPQGQLLDLTD